MNLIAVEGTDGSGKNTVASWIIDLYAAEGKTAVVMIHPSERKTGMLMKRCLQGERVMYILSVMFFVLDLLVSIHKSKTTNTDAIIFVRYTLSAAYLPSRFVKIGYDFLSSLFPNPDHKIFVDVSPETAIKRIHERNETWEMFETEEKIDAVRTDMLSISAEWDILDNNGSPEETKLHLWQLVQSWQK